jgi:methylated-DNA-[protein]-cysteine S-methyltransferase
MMSDTFNNAVWKLCKQIPKGKVSTYGDIARAMNSKAYRAVGSALNKNPYGICDVGANDPRMVPCHRVINSDGRIEGFALGVEKKKELLFAENVSVLNDEIDLKHYGHHF